MKEAAGARDDSLELNSLIGFVMITDDVSGIIDVMAPHFGIDTKDALHIPLALIGTLDEMVEELRWRRVDTGSRTGRSRPTAGSSSHRWCRS